MKYGRFPYQVAIFFHRGKFSKLLLTIEEVLYLLGNLVTAWPDGGTNTCVDIARLATKLLVHSLYRCSSNAASGAAPSCMCHTDCLLYRIIVQYRNAVGGRECQCNSTLLRNNSIGLAAWLDRPDQFLRIHKIRAMRPVEAPVVSAIYVQRSNVCSVYQPERSARIVLYIQRRKGLQAIAYHILKFVSAAKRDIQSPIRCLAISSQACKAAMNNF